MGNAELTHGTAEGETGLSCEPCRCSGLDDTFGGLLWQQRGSLLKHLGERGFNRKRMPEFEVLLHRHVGLKRRPADGCMLTSGHYPSPAETALSHHAVCTNNDEDCSYSSYIFCAAWPRHTHPCTCDCVRPPHRFLRNKAKEEVKIARHRLRLDEA